MNFFWLIERTPAIRNDAELTLPLPEAPTRAMVSPAATDKLYPLQTVMLGRDGYANSTSLISMRPVGYNIQGNENDGGKIYFTRFHNAKYEISVEDT